MPNLLSFGLNTLADVFYPKYCFRCKRAGRYLCKFCINQIPAVTKNFCVVCNSPSLKGFTHLQCGTPLTPERLLSAFPYKDPVISDMRVTGKYYFIKETFAVLGALTADTLFHDQLAYGNNLPALEGELKDFVVTAIPLHRRRLLWRGFNQSEVAAKIFAQGLGMPYGEILKRTKNTKTQKNLDAQSRRSNMANAFACKYQCPAKIILIDDVTTTGRTFLEAAAVLKQAGAKTVWCISIAKD